MKGYIDPQICFKCKKEKPKFVMSDEKITKGRFRGYTNMIVQTTCLDCLKVFKGNGHECSKRKCICDYYTNGELIKEDFRCIEHNRKKHIKGQLNTLMKISNLICLLISTDTSKIL